VTWPASRWRPWGRRGEGAGRSGAEAKDLGAGPKVGALREAICGRGGDKQVVLFDNRLVAISPSVRAE